MEKVRDTLMDTHRLLLEAQRAIYEQQFGPVSSPYVFLKLTLEHEHFQWLRPIGKLILEWDDLKDHERSAQWILGWLERVEQHLQLETPTSPLGLLEAEEHKTDSWKERIAQARRKVQPL